MDRETLLAAIAFGRGRLLNILDTIEKSAAPPASVLAWRPGSGRAHIGWQAMHCAATLDRYVNVHLLSGSPRDPGLVAAYGGGSTPVDENIPDLATIRSALEAHYLPFREFVAQCTPAEFSRKLAHGRDVGQSILLLTWHEAHHQGQIHLTWNLYKAAHGIG